MLATTTLSNMLAPKERCECEALAVEDGRCNSCNRVHKVKLLSDRELQIEVGKAAGFDVMTWKGVPGVYYQQDHRCDLVLPMFTVNLNAIHEIEVKMDRLAKANFTYWLVKVTGGNSLNDYVSATARQRAEAFYLALR